GGYGALNRQCTYVVGSTAVQYRFDEYAEIPDLAGFVGERLSLHLEPETCAPGEAQWNIEVQPLPRLRQIRRRRLCRLRGTRAFVRRILSKIRCLKSPTEWDLIKSGLDIGSKLNKRA